MQHQSTPTAQHHARTLRREMTDSERKLWSRLRGEQVGVKFRKQHPIDSYILDFYCAAAKLAVEVDGLIHGDPDQTRHDEKRAGWLHQQGIGVLRVAACDVRDELDGVLNAIRYAALKRSS